MGVAVVTFHSSLCVYLCISFFPQDIYTNSGSRIVILVSLNVSCNISLNLSTRTKNTLFHVRGTKLERPSKVAIFEQCLNCLHCVLIWSNNYDVVHHLVSPCPKPSWVRAAHLIEMNSISSSHTDFPIIQNHYLRILHFIFVPARFLSYKRGIRLIT